MDDWKKVVGVVAPGLATLLGGPLAGGVVKILADKVLGGSTGDEAQDQAALSQALSGGMTPELRAELSEDNARLASDGYRTLAFAFKEVTGDTPLDA